MRVFLWQVMVKLVGAAGWIGLIGLIGPAGCSAPALHFDGIAPLRVTVQGSTFDLRRRKGRWDMVQLVRINAEFAPRLSQQLGRRAEIAVERTYGCPVRQILGDAAVMVAQLDCGAADGLARIANGP